MVAHFCTLAAAQAVPHPNQANKIGIVMALDTTVVSGPMKSNGEVDYAAALNAIEGRGINPADNAACVLIELAGPGALHNDPAERAEVLRLLGMSEPTDWPAVWPGAGGARLVLHVRRPRSPTQSRLEPQICR